MRKSPRASRLLDIFHKGFVWTCIGVSAYGLVIGATRFYHYLNVTRPKRLADKEDLLREERQSPPIADSELLKN